MNFFFKNSCFLEFMGLLDVAYLIPLNFRAPLIFAHPGRAKIKVSKFAHQGCAKIRGARKVFLGARKLKGARKLEGVLFFANF